MNTVFRVTALLALAAAPASARAQRDPAAGAGAPPEPRGQKEVTVYAGYQLGSNVSTSSGFLQIEGAPIWGASVGLEVLPGWWAELLWLYSRPIVNASGSPLLAGSLPLEVSTHYFQVGATKGVRWDRLTVFAGATLGAVLSMPGALHYADGSTTSLDTTWWFAFMLGGGLKVDLWQQLALRLETRVAAPVCFTECGLYVSEADSGMGVRGGVPAWQWNFLGGLVLVY